MLPLSLLLTLLPALGHAVPTTQADVDNDPAAAPARPGSPFTIPVRANPHHVPDGPAELAAAYRKWDMPVPEGLERHELSRRAGYSSGISAATSTGGDSYWLSDIYVGYPEAQALPVMIDSGSPDFWLLSTDTQFPEVASLVARPPLYNPKLSEASQEVPGFAWNVQYSDKGSSDLRGKVYFDNLRIGKIGDLHWFNITNATIQSAVTIGPRIAVDPRRTGVLGIAKTRRSTITPQMPTTMDRLRAELHFESIGIDLRHNSSRGFFDFGSGRTGGAADLVHEPVPVPATDHWDFRVSLFRMSTMGESEWWTTAFLATVDTGTSLLLLPGIYVAKYYSEIPGATFDTDLQSWLFPCDIASGIPDFEFQTSGGYRGKLPKEYINFGPVPSATDKCFGSIQNSASKQAIFGAAVLKTMYVQLNYGEQGSFVSFGKKGLDACSFTSTCTV
ncbi:aspartic proteinase [Colletotrichum karsti]|uniref:Aspartic proteinase n=1 Tax=Colletotrichum karsti TaxID=1095194 RepID=A0A9P6I7Z5_9PEZI|nr:aspartic proteinase [Colletotrichum karsti]KAF9878918.1 aspartic proteinase [Colletotrichum karsti]